MSQFPHRRRQLPPGRGRAPARWTAWEVLLVIFSVLLIVFPFYAEVINWLNPPSVPALQRVTNTPPVDTPTPGGPPTATVGVPTETPTPGGPSATDTPTAGLPTETPPPGSTPPTATPPPGSTPLTATPPTSVPTDTPLPTATAPGGINVRVFKVASVSQASPGQEYSYSITVVTNSATNIEATMQDSFDGNLEVLSASTSSGSCSSGQTVNCTLTIKSDMPASITVNVRVRPSVASGTVINNQASASGAGASGSSDVVTVTVSGQVVPTPGAPTNTATTGPGVPTNTATTGPIAPTSPPPPPPPDSGGRPQPTQTPPPPPAPPTPTVAPPPPPPPPPPVTQPRQPGPIGTVVQIQGTAQPTMPISISGPAATSTQAVRPAADASIILRMASDWGSARPGQEVEYILVLRNERSQDASGVNDLRNVVVNSRMPANLEVQGATADRQGDPTVNGNDIEYTIDRLQPGEGIEITVRTAIKQDVSRGTLIVSQGQVNYNSLTQPIFSNIVTVQVVDAPAPPTNTASPVATPTNTVSPVSTETPTNTASPAPTETPTQSAAGSRGRPPSNVTTITPTIVLAGGAPAGGQADLPATDSGVPLMGFVLLGATLLIRTYRLHRARERI